MPPPSAIPGAARHVPSSPPYRLGCLCIRRAPVRCPQTVRAPSLSPPSRTSPRRRSAASAARCARAARRRSRARRRRGRTPAAAAGGAATGRESRLPDDLADRRRELTPLGRLGAKLRAARRGQRVNLDALSDLGFAPRGLDPTATFHAVEGRVERALLDAKSVVGRLLDPPRDRVAMAR